MARNASAIDGYITTASDGDLGTVSDFLFDDTSCPVRWLVVDTRKCLSGRNVLLPTLVLEHLDAERKEFAVWLTMQQVKDSPDVDTERPVSRQMEASVYDYCGWRPYLGGRPLHGQLHGYVGGYRTMGSAMLVQPALGTRQREEQATRLPGDDEDPHLRSIKSVTGYHTHAGHGEIGHVNDFLVDDADWTIHYVVVETTNWWRGKKTPISPRSVKDIA